VAPQAATIEAFKALGLDIIPGSGLLAACVPGSFGAWMTLLRDYGTVGLRDVLEPAITYARDGYILLPRIAAAIRIVEPLFRSEWPTSRDVYLRPDVPEAGALFTNPDLAATYEKILASAEAAGGSRERQIEAAQRAFYQGFIAEAIDRFARNNEVMDTSGRRHRGLITGQDMATWQPTYEEPLSVDYHGFRVCKPGVWTQGPVFLQQLALLSGFDLGALDPVGDEFVHLVTECSKLAFADREKFYGDPAFADVPVATLLSAPYSNARRELVGRNASAEFRPGNIPGYDQQVPYTITSDDGSEGTSLGAGEPTVGPSGASKGDTVHFDIIDRFGNMVSATPSGGWLQSSPVIPGFGFTLGTRAQMFWLQPGLPASLVPGKRPRTTLSVTMVERNGEPYLSFGTPGGDQQDQWSLAFFLRHVHHVQNLQQGIDLPMFHNDHMPSSFFPRQAKPASLTVEQRFTPEVLRRLEARGHKVETVSEWSLGRLSAASRNGKVLRAAANARYMQGYAFGR
jgi:gamma-glutamyltranspeptidase/glutathione hydrolase